MKASVDILGTLTITFIVAAILVIIGEATGYRVITVWLFLFVEYIATHYNFEGK